MKKQLFSTITMLLAAGTMMMTSCTKNVEEAQLDGTQPQVTRAYGDKSPKVMAYVEINDNNPLIGKSYHLGTSASDPVFIDILNLFASNVHKDAAGYPTIYFNDKMAPMFEAVNTYVKPLQDAGMKVCLTVLGDWQGIGVANLNAAQADRFADILVYIVNRYGLDGINFDDEYSNYPSTVSGSYSRIIKALRAKFDTKFGVGGKLITVFQWGAYSQIDATAGAMLDWADHGSFGPAIFQSSSSISGMTNARWMPQAINLGSNYNALSLTTIKNNAVKSKNYGGIMCFNVRRASDVNPLPVFQKIAEGAFGSTVTYDGNDYTRDWTPNPNGYTITKEMAGTFLPTYVD